MLKLIDLRRSRGLTQSELADKAQINQTAVSLYEQGHRSPNLRTARRLAEVLGCSVDDIEFDALLKEAE